MDINGFICNFAASSSEPNTGPTEPVESEPSGGEVERTCGESEERIESYQLSPKVYEEPQSKEKGTKLSFIKAVHLTNTCSLVCTL